MDITQSSLHGVLSAARWPPTYLQNSIVQHDSGHSPRPQEAWLNEQRLTTGWFGEDGASGALFMRSLVHLFHFTSVDGMIPLSRGLKSWYFLRTVVFVLFYHSVCFWVMSHYS